MSIDSENNCTPAAETPATKGPRKARKAKPAKTAGRRQEASRQAESGPR